MNNIRNFAIIAHVDHGKSTLADRFLEITGVVKKGEHQEQLLDRNPISRERGITIKLAPVRMNYQNCILNLIDTPGHIDFSYEVERTLACVEGVILLVDAVRGIQAQTIAHAHSAIEQNKIIIPAINKIDMPSAKIEKTKTEIAKFLRISKSEVYEISAKTGKNAEELLKAVIEKIPAPNNYIDKTLIFDSYYDQYRGVIAFVRVFDGELKARLKVKLYATNTIFQILEVGIFTPDLKPSDSLKTGEIGYIATNLKDIHLVRVGDTICNVDDNCTQRSRPLSAPLVGYRKVKPMVFASVFPTDPDKYLDLKKAIEKLTLNDSSLTFQPIYSSALGSGLRCGFLGILHADVVCERLEREFNLNLILTSPTVEYKININTHGPNSNQHQGLKMKKYLEPIAEINIVTPQEYVGVVMKLCEDARGVFLTMDNKSQIYLSYKIPLSELITNFYDQLKTITSGYASLDWHFSEYQAVDADKLTILLNSSPVEEFSEFVVVERAFERGRELVKRLRKLIPRQQYEIKIQAQYKGKIIASERIAPFRKDVTGKLYGGDRTRKDKLLERQKKGKKMMKNIGRVEIPKEVFFKVFKNLR